MPDSTAPPAASRPLLADRLRGRPAYAVVYMFALTFFCAAVLLGIERATSRRVEANRAILFERALLTATLPGEVTDATSSQEVHDRFKRIVQPPDASSGNAYRVVKDGRLVAYGLVLAGQGFWDTVLGVMGVASDRTTVTGVAFYQQNETPGLGAEIAKPTFRDRFKGRRLAAGDPALRLARPGSEPREDSVEAITGATQTCTRVEKIIADTIRAWRMVLPDDAGVKP